MFIEHALRKLKDVHEFFTEILKKRRLRRRVATIADGRWLQRRFLGSMRASSQFDDTDR